MLHSALCFFLHFRNHAFLCIVPGIDFTTARFVSIKSTLYGTDQVGSKLILPFVIILTQPRYKYNAFLMQFPDTIWGFSCSATYSTIYFLQNSAKYALTLETFAYRIGMMLYRNYASVPSIPGYCKQRNSSGHPCRS